MINMAIDVRGSRVILEGLAALAPGYTKAIDELKQEVGLKLQRRARRYAPKRFGGLERSIQFRVPPGDSVFLEVPSNAEAASYAYPMHYGHYNPGPGTRAKGAQAGRLYLTRAIQDETENIRQLVEKRLNIRTVWRRGRGGGR
jgi:hypothetical protein